MEKSPPSWRAESPWIPHIKPSNHSSFQDLKASRNEKKRIFGYCRILKNFSFQLEGILVANIEKGRSLALLSWKNQSVCLVLDGFLTDKNPAWTAPPTPPGVSQTINIAFIFPTSKPSNHCHPISQAQLETQIPNCLGRSLLFLAGASLRCACLKVLEVHQFFPKLTGDSAA